MIGLPPTGATGPTSFNPMEGPKEGPSLDSEKIVTGQKLVPGVVQNKNLKGGSVLTKLLQKPSLDEVSVKVQGPPSTLPEGMPTQNLINPLAKALLEPWTIS